MDQMIVLLRQENVDLKRKIQDQNNVVVGLRRDLAGASARLSDMTGENKLWLNYGKIKLLTLGN